jgi:Ca2+-binding RTX toxin-like protein
MAITNITGTSGNDSWLLPQIDLFVDGLGGIDTATIGATQTDLISITVDSTGVVTLTGASNSATLQHVEYIKFDDGTIGVGSLIADSITGGAMADKLYGLAGNDILNGGGGGDKMLGGTGNDIYTVNHAADTITELSGQGVDLVKSSVSHKLGANVEKLTLTGSGAINGTGNPLANVLIGNGAANKLYGLGGNDTLNGGAGNDLLTGGTGKDYLTSGTGNDIFDFNTISESSASTSRDVINDFSASDKLDLSTIDANAGLTGNQAFTLTTGAAFSGSFSGAGKLYYDTSTHILWGNNDADAQADFSIQVKLSGLANLTAGDFVL